MGKHIVKRHGKEQAYDEKKVYASVFASSLNCHYDDEKSERIADDVTKVITSWAKQREFTRSEDIRDEILRTLDHQGHHEVALMYKHHLDLS